MTSSSSAHDLSNPPEFFSVWAANLPIVFSSIKLHVPMVLLLVVSGIVQLAVPLVGMLASIASMIALIFIQYTVMKAVWSKITDGVPRYSIMDTAVQWRMVGVSVLVNVCSFLLALLLAFPGIWFAIKSSFGIMTTCLENRSGWDAVTRSHALTKGNWWRTFWFHSIAPMLIILGLFIVLLIVAFVLGLVVGLVSRDLAGMLKGPLTMVFLLVVYCAYLTMIPPQVHLYAYLNARNKAASVDDLASIKQAQQ